MQVKYSSKGFGQVYKLILEHQNQSRWEDTREDSSTQ